jgi:hypothetical protein
VRGFLSRLGTLAGAAVAPVAAGWSSFWFRPADPLPLGVIRVGAGVVLLGMLLATTPLLPALYGPDAWVDRETADTLRKESPSTPPHDEWDPPPGEPDRRRPAEYHAEWAKGPGAEAYVRRWGILPQFVFARGTARFSPFFHIRTIEGAYAFHAVSVLVAVLFTLGLGGRVVCVLAWAVALCYIHRVHPAMSTADTALALLLLYLALGPSTARLSLDRRLGLPPGTAPSEGANLALRLMQVHFAAICLASGLSKLQGAVWWNGTAVWQILGNVGVPRPELYWSALRILAHNHLVLEAFQAGVTLFTLGVEVGLPFLVWRPAWRPVCVTAAVLFYTAAALATGQAAFGALMILLAGSFIPAAALRRLLPASGPREGPES